MSHDVDIALLKQSVKHNEDDIRRHETALSEFGKALAALSVSGAESVLRSDEILRRIEDLEQSRESSSSKSKGEIELRRERIKTQAIIWTSLIAFLSTVAAALIALL